MHKNLMNKSHHQVVVVVEAFAAVVVVGFPACCCWVFMYFIGNGRGGVFDNNAVQLAASKDQKQLVSNSSKAGKFESVLVLWRGKGSRGGCNFLSKWCKICQRKTGTPAAQEESFTTDTDTKFRQIWENLFNNDDNDDNANDNDF